MSSGQKAYEEDMEERAWEERKARLGALGLSATASKIDAIAEQFKFLEESLPALPRAGWYRIDEIKKLLRELR